MSATDAKRYESASFSPIAGAQTLESGRLRETGHLSMLAALVEAAEDIDSGRVLTWHDFKPRLDRLRAKARRIAPR
jgi:hypothetical protein